MNPNTPVRGELSLADVRQYVKDYDKISKVNIIIRATVVILLLSAIYVLSASRYLVWFSCLLVIWHELAMHKKRIDLLEAYRLLLKVADHTTSI